MSKLIAAGTAALGGTATAVGGSYLLQKGTGTEGGMEKTKSTTEATPQNPISSDLSSFTNLEEFRNKKGGDCAKNFFGEVDYSSKGSPIDSSHSVSKDDLTTTTQGVGDPKSCLIINWEKNEASDTASPPNNKGKGTFKWLWSFVNGDKGFVMFYTTKTSSKDKQLDLEAGIYFLSKENSKGNIKKHKEETGTSKNMSKDSFDKSFPQNADNFDGLDEKHKSNGGFVKGGDDFENLCKDGDSDCPQNAQITSPNLKEVGNGEAKSKTGNDTPDKWNKAFTKNLEYLFEKDGFNMSDAFAAFQGSWKKQTSSDK